MSSHPSATAHTHTHTHTHLIHPSTSSSQLSPICTLESLEFNTIITLKDYLRCILYTIIFQRSLGVVFPVDITCDSYDYEIIYSKSTDENIFNRDIESKLEQSIQQFTEKLDKVYSMIQQRNTSTMTLIGPTSSSKQGGGQGHGHDIAVYGNLSLGFFEKSTHNANIHRHGDRVGSSGKQRTLSTTSDTSISTSPATSQLQTPSTVALSSSSSPSSWFTASVNFIKHATSTVTGATAHDQQQRASSKQQAHPHSADHRHAHSSTSTQSQIHDINEHENRIFWERWVIPVVYRKKAPSSGFIDTSTSSSASSSSQQQIDSIRNVLMDVVTYSAERKSNVPFVSSKVNSSLPLLFPFEISFAVSQTQSTSS